MDDTFMVLLDTACEEAAVKRPDLKEEIQGIRQRVENTRREYLIELCHLTQVDTDPFDKVSLEETGVDFERMNSMEECALTAIREIQ